MLDAVAMSINAEVSTKTQQNALALGGDIRNHSPMKIGSQIDKSRGSAAHGGAQRWKLWKAEAKALSLRIYFCLDRIY